MSEICPCRNPGETHRASLHDYHDSTPTEREAGDVGEVAAVLAGHVLRDVDPACSCGWDWDSSKCILPSQVDFDSTRYRLSGTVRPEQHRAHIADLLAPLIAEREAKAWDEGHASGGRDQRATTAAVEWGDDLPDLAENPYRAAENAQDAS